VIPLFIETVPFDLIFRIEGIGKSTVTDSKNMDAVTRVEWTLSDGLTHGMHNLNGLKKGFVEITSRIFDIEDKTILWLDDEKQTIHFNGKEI
ncbi:MAG: hypothetical protein LIO77_04025, partial [Rikenellaceae bacterium]|nr:hypothetical protein [Rikenellaceae bacterium]